MISVATLNAGNCGNLENVHDLAAANDGHRNYLWHNECKGCDATGRDYSLVQLRTSGYRYNEIAGAALIQMSATKFDRWPYGAAKSSHELQDTLKYFLR